MIPSDRPLTLQQVIGNVGVYELPGHVGLLFKSRMMIDADGAPNAYHPGGGQPLDYLGNAGKPGNWWGVITESGQRDGTPVVQKAGDPCPGYHVSATSLCDPSKRATDPRRYVNSDQVPYVALPKQMVERGVRLGDFAVVVRASTGAICHALFADGGPSGKLGEGSIALARALGIACSPKNGGTEKRDVIYLVFPGSRAGWPLTIEQINANASRLFTQWGGMEQLRACFAERDLSKPLDDFGERAFDDGGDPERPTLEELGES